VPTTWEYPLPVSRSTPWLSAAPLGSSRGQNPRKACTFLPPTPVHRTSKRSLVHLPSKTSQQRKQSEDTTGKDGATRCFPPASPSLPAVLFPISGYLFLCGLCTGTGFFLKKFDKKYACSNSQRKSSFRVPPSPRQGQFFKMGIKKAPKGPHMHSSIPSFTECLCGT